MVKTKQAQKDLQVKRLADMQTNTLYLAKLPTGDVVYLQPYEKVLHVQVEGKTELKAQAKNLVPLCNACGR